MQAKAPRSSLTLACTSPPAQEPPLRRVHDQQPPVGQEVDAHRERRDADDDLVVAVGIKRDHLMGAPVGKPDPPLVPAGRLAEHDPFHQHSHTKSDCPLSPNSSVTGPAPDRPQLAGSRTNTGMSLSVFFW